MTNNTRSHTADNKRIAKNTVALYARSLIILAISLYTSRAVLAALGFVDYGIYSVVGSVIVMFQMFSATFVGSTQRFLNFSLGQGDSQKAQKVFSVAINIHIVLAFFLLVLLETLGLWFLNTKLNIPEERYFAANVVYHLSVITFVVQLFSVPFEASVVANEKMHIFAYVSIYQAVVKLGIALFITRTSFDKLILYGFLMMLVSVTVIAFYYFYCTKKHNECKYVKVRDNALYKEIISISGWNFLGSSATILTVSGMGVVINFFTNVVVNTAKGIASQVEGVVNQLVDSFMTSIRPQITKSFAADDNSYLLSLISRGTRFSFYLMCALCLPILFSTEFILFLWLKDIPQYTVPFVQFTLVYIMIKPFSNILDGVLLATGKIKQSQIRLSVLQLLNLPLSCIILYLGLAPYLIYLSYIVISYMSLAVRLHYSIKNSKLTFSFYSKNIISKIIIVLLLSVLVPLIILYLINITNSTVLFLFKSLIVEITLFMAVFFFGIEDGERLFFINVIKNKIFNKSNDDIHIDA